MKFIDSDALRRLQAQGFTIEGARVDPAKPAAKQADVVGAERELMSEAELRQMLAASDALWMERCEALQRQIDLLTALQNAPRTPPTWHMTATYREDGSIDQLVATPQRTVQ